MKIFHTLGLGLLLFTGVITSLPAAQAISVSHHVTHSNISRGHSYSSGSRYPTSHRQSEMPKVLPRSDALYYEMFSEEAMSIRKKTDAFEKKCASRDKKGNFDYRDFFRHATATCRTKYKEIYYPLYQELRQERENVFYDLYNDRGYSTLKEFKKRQSVALWKWKKKSKELVTVPSAVKEMIAVMEEDRLAEDVYKIQQWIEAFKEKCFYSHSSKAGVQKKLRNTPFCKEKVSSFYYWKKSVSDKEKKIEKMERERADASVPHFSDKNTCLKTCSSLVAKWGGESKFECNLDNENKSWYCNTPSCMHVESKLVCPQDVIAKNKDECKFKALRFNSTIQYRRPFTSKVFSCRYEKGKWIADQPKCVGSLIEASPEEKKVSTSLKAQ